MIVPPTGGGSTTTGSGSTITEEPAAIGGRQPGSQFFIVVHDYAGAVQGKPAPLRIEPRYTVFGQVESDFYGSLETIARQQVVGGKDRIRAAEPTLPIFIERIQIIELSKGSGG